MGEEREVFSRSVLIFCQTRYDKNPQFFFLRKRRIEWRKVMKINTLKTSLNKKAVKLKPIEYIGAAPTPKKPKKSASGWFLIAFVALLSFFLAKPFVQLVQAQRSQPNATNLEEARKSLLSGGSYGSKLAAAALERTKYEVVYDRSYRVIEFPGGDVPSDRGQAEDVIIRAYRSLGADLQLLVNDDMTANFREYPRLSGLKEPDSNIDHRCTPNLQRFFVRNGESIPPSNSAEDYNFGDIVVWHLPEQSIALGGHIGIVVPGPGKLGDDKWIVHNNGSGPLWENELFSYPIIGHYRYVHENLLVEAALEGAVKKMF